ncbi:MAG TPA: hypothetical protein VFH11_14700 [Gemmatimonadota bacterium]|nr:hypothetical protein [Gemmatimonadota bacterium]
MRRSLVFIVALLAVPALPSAVRAAIQQDPVGGRPLDPHYADQADQERRDERRREQDERRSADPCALGCGDYEGLQTRGIPGTALVAVLHRTEIDDDVLTARLRFYNEGETPAHLTIDPTVAEEAFVLRIGAEEYPILRNEDGELEAKEALSLELEPGEMETWWVKFPAPPAGASRIDLEIPPVASFHDVPLDAD